MAWNNLGMLLKYRGGFMHRFVVLLIVWFICRSAMAQDPVEEMMRKIKERTEAQMKKTEKYVRDYIARDDSLFADFLKKDWEYFQAYQGRLRDPKPKPKELPAAEPKPTPPLPGGAAKVIAQPEPEPKAQPPAPPPPPPDVKRGTELNFDYFTMPIKLMYDEKTKITLHTPINNLAISNFWDELSRTDFADLKTQIDGYVKRMNLNDYGCAQLLYQTGKQIYGDKPNEIRLFIWFMLVKSGYKARVGYNNAGVYLLLPIRNMVYSVPYLTLGGQQYFAIRFENEPELTGALYTYDTEYPGADRSLSLMVPAAPQFKNAVLQKNLTFSYGGKQYSLALKYSDDAVRFFKYYPQTDWDVYFSYQTAPAVQNAILNALKPIITGRSEPDAVNLILRFVQTAFEYKTDDDNFGREKPLFPDETVFYDFSDCEDRSIMFAYLVRELLGLEVVGLHYPGHMATAVRFVSAVSGDFVSFEGKNYLVCDPTYINADIGMAMPQFKNVSPNVVKIKAL